LAGFRLVDSGRTKLILIMLEMQKQFQSLFFQAKDIGEKKKTGYKLYSADGQIETVIAETAALAMEQAQNKNPVRIEKIGVVKKYIFNDQELVDFEVTKEAKPSEVEASPTDAPQNQEGAIQKEQPTEEALAQPIEETQPEEQPQEELKEEQQEEGQA
jgi:hypothetical protein